MNDKKALKRTIILLQPPRFDHIAITTKKICIIPSMPVKRPKSQLRRYQQFAKTVPKSSFGALLPRPTLLHAYKIMSDRKMVPKGLRESEVECSNFKKPPIPYIPVDGKIGEKVKSEARTFKVKIDDKTTVKIICLDRRESQRIFDPCH